jgi:hypothetical protein
MLTPHLRNGDLDCVIDLPRTRMRPVGPVGQACELVSQIPRHPPVHRRPVHTQLHGNLHHISPAQNRPDRIQALLDN